jgi:hypothetical protein
MRIHDLHGMLSNAIHSLLHLEQLVVNHAIELYDAIVFDHCDVESVIVKDFLKLSVGGAVELGSMVDRVGEKALDMGGNVSAKARAEGLEVRPWIRRWVMGRSWRRWRRRYRW